MRKLLLLPAILFCFAINILAQEQIESEEYEIYKTLLGNGNQAVVYKFSDNSDLDFIFKSSFYKRELSIVDSETRKNYRFRNQKSYELKNNFGIEPKVKLVSDEDVQPFFEMAKKNDLAAEDAFYKMFGSRTLILLSRVGFDKNKNQALVSIVSNTGLCGTCSTNYIFVLSKENNFWVVKKKVIGWIS